MCSICLYVYVHVNEDVYVRGYSRHMVKDLAKIKGRLARGLTFSWQGKTKSVPWVL